MYVVAKHEISDPERFWSAIQGAGDLPEGVSIHSTLPSPDGAKAVCVWEADSVETIRELVEGTVGESSRNEFFEVDASNAQGLPG
jgi:hypothetical protein